MLLSRSCAAAEGDIDISPERTSPIIERARGKPEMAQDRAVHIMLGLCTAILVVASLYLARSIFAPVTFAIFIIAIVWPLQSALQAKMPKLLALAITLFVTVVVVTVMGSLVAWGFGVVGHWLFENSARLQALYGQTTSWLEGHGIFVTGMLSEYFDVSWLIRAFQQLTGRVHGLATFALVTLIFLLLGLLEVDTARKKLAGLSNREAGQSLLKAGEIIAAKFRRYMLVRTAMSIITGFVIFGFAWVAGLELATAWGVIAFTLNYIPFVGPFVATVLPTLFAIAQSESWEMAVIVFLCLNLIQFLIGSYLEPRVAGATLSISPFMVLFAVFFSMFLWSIPGAFIGVPILVAALTICEQYPSTQWVAELLSGREDATG
jgi:predicted PurR-regulated permease PerM